MFRLQTQLRQFIYDVSKHFGFEVVIFSQPWFSAAPSARRGVVNLNEAFPRLVSKENELLPPFNGAIICFLKNHHAFVLATVLYLVFYYRYIVRHDCNVLRWLVKFFLPINFVSYNSNLRGVRDTYFVACQCVCLTTYGSQYLGIYIH